MIKAFLLIFEPLQTWEKIAVAQRSIAAIFWTFLMPLILITSVVEGYGLVHWGKLYGDPDYPALRKFPVSETVVYETAQALLTIIVVLAAAKTLKALGDTFHGRHSFRQAFTTIVYGLSPLFVVRLLDGFLQSQFSPWATWAVGVGMSVVVLYQGLPRVMLPDPPHAFGLYLMNSLMLVLITGLERFVTAWYLSGHFKPVEEFIKTVAAKLPF